MTTAIGAGLRQRLDGGSQQQLVAQLFAFLSERGQSNYDESVTQLEHALQCAQLARNAQCPAPVVTAALLHDIGHLLVDEHEGRQGFLDQDLQHEHVGADFLKDYFGAEVTDPIRLHVPAKRYLCTIDTLYFEKLSMASKRSLQVQGGVFSDAERLEFEKNPHLDMAVMLRRFDDQGKASEKTTSSLEDFTEDVMACLSKNGRSSG